MANTVAELVKKPLYVFDLPSELLSTLQPKAGGPTESATKNEILDNSRGTTKVRAEPDEVKDGRPTCNLCDCRFVSTSEQRQHVKSDWHNYNLKQKGRAAKLVSEDEFDRLVEELDESLSGSGSDVSDSDSDHAVTKESVLSAVLKKQARISHETNDGVADDDTATGSRKRKRGAGEAPLSWLSSSALPSNMSLGVYKALLTNEEQADHDLLGVLYRKQLRPVPAKVPLADDSNGVPLPSSMTSPSIFMCMVGGGHFAGMVVSLAPKIGKQVAGNEQRQAIVIAHKTFHRYTTRRKQGGGQSANDAAKGAAHSAGSSLRRYNEVALENDIRNLLSEWREFINKAQLVFVRATGSANRRILFGPYEGQVLRANDLRNRTFPFSTRRATQAELMRAFVELTRIKVSQVDEAAIAAAEAAAEAEAQAKATAAAQAKQAGLPKPQPPQLTAEEEASTLHTTQIQALIRRSKAPALQTYLTSNDLLPDFTFYPPSHHAPTPLHLASSINSPILVLSLLTKTKASPTLLNGDGKPAFDLAGDRSTRDAFRLARHTLGESAHDWARTHIPPALSKEEYDQREEAARTNEIERRKAEEERLKREGPQVVETRTQVVAPNINMRKTAEEKREEESRGMTPEMRMKMERERRARAAEARFKK